MISDPRPTPDWDLEQLEVILDDPESWQFVVAGPGAGKSAVACQRVAHLVDDGIPPSRILLVSFTRTAVAELRDRIVSYALAGDHARGVRISTIDSHAWSLRAGFEDERIPISSGDDSYDVSIKLAVDLFRNEHPDLLDFMSRIEHLIIDEAQDVLGVRADLVIEMLRNLSDECGVTILADPAQAIYGFTSDDLEDAGERGSLIQRLDAEAPRPLKSRQLSQIHRIRNQHLLKVFRLTREEVEQEKGGDQHADRVTSIIRETAVENLAATSFEALAEYLAVSEGESPLVLFRRRADVLMASSYCSSNGVEHRLRMSGTPLIVRPWLGWLFLESDRTIIPKQEFDYLWAQRSAISAAPFEGEQQEGAWSLLRQLAAGDRPDVVDLYYLRTILSRSRPPVEVCQPEIGTEGPILGTIHASKGREADSVALVMPLNGHSGHVSSREAALEEGRVYYVGATRAREKLVTAGNTALVASRLDSGRVYRRSASAKGKPPRVQIEIGREGDVDTSAHLSWTNAVEIQCALADAAGKTLPLAAVSIPERGYERRLVLEVGVGRGLEIGRLGDTLQTDIGKVWSMVDSSQTLRPAERINHLYLIGVTTVALPDGERSAYQPPFRNSGFALAPIIKGFPMVLFQYRKRRSY